MFSPAINPGGRETEKQLLLEYLHTKVGAHGFYVDVGANDPFEYSQSHMLEERGWDGMCIEPQPRFAAALRQTRKAMVVQKACGAPGCMGQKLPLTVLGATAALEPGRVFSTYHADDRFDVEMDTLDNILDEHGVGAVDFLSLDVDGYEPEVLMGFTATRYKPKLILIEDHLFNFRKHRALTTAGYKWVRRTGVNNWYVPVNESFAVSAFGRLQLFRKAYVGMPFRNLKRWLHILIGR